jgi:hypothetical protein
MVPAPSQIVYRGPIRAPMVGTANDSIVVEISQQSAVNGSTSLGAQGVVYSNTFGSGSSDWSNFVNLYKEARVLGFRVQYAPHYGWGNTNVNHGSGLWVSSHVTGSLTPYTSLNTMIENNDWKLFHTGQGSSYEWKMASTEEAQFSPVTSMPTSGNIAYFVPTATTSSVPYGNLYITYRIQFRDRV